MGHARPSSAPHLPKDQEGMPKRTMALAGGTFPSALPPHCIRGQTWQCQKGSAMGDRNTLHGRHQKTALTQHPAPREQRKCKAATCPLTIQTHLDHLTDTCPCHEGTDQLSLGGRTIPWGWWPWHVSDRGRRWRRCTPAQGEPALSAHCSELTPRIKGIY